MNLQSVSMPLTARLLFASCLLLPAVASAQGAVIAQMAPPMAIWPSEYERLDSMEGGADANLILKTAAGEENGSTGVVDRLEIPFPFRILGDGPHTTLNVGSKGYVVFGGTGNLFSANRNTPQIDDDSQNTLRRVIAAWWGSNYCTPNGGIKTKTLGDAPNRIFIIEWADCSKELSSAETDVKFETQIWLYEGSSVVRVHYGTIVPDSGTQQWILNWGIKGAVGKGFMGPGIDGQRNFCTTYGQSGDPIPRCKASDFPKNSVIQYGLSPDVDLSARVKPDVRNMTVTSTTFQLKVDTTLLNVGSPAISGVGYTLYLSPSAAVDPDLGGMTPVYTREPTLSLAGGEALPVVDEITAERPANGTYRLCARIDPDNTLRDSDRSNNWVCSHEHISFGPDLVVDSVAAPGQPASGEPGGLVTVPVTISNIGNDPVGAFDYKLVAAAVLTGNSTEEVTILEQTLEDGLAAGEQRTLSLTGRLHSPARFDEYRFQLELDPGTLLNESNRLNNTKTSDHKMKMNRPRVQITSSPPPIDLPDGCFYGEEIRATFQACNVGQAEARDFIPGVIMGDGTQIFLQADVTATSFPQFCGTPGTWNYTQCEPVGSLGSVCVLEYCRAECQNNAECGAGRICAHDEKLSEFLGREANGCITWLSHQPPQAQKCQTYTMRGKIPMQNSEDGELYEDGMQYFHRIGDALHNLSEDAPHTVTDEPILCRQAKLDLAVVDMKPATRLVAGKDVAISRLIENKGFINFQPGGVTRPDSETFTYRYYLGPTRDISVQQIPLQARNVSGGISSATITRKGSNLGTDVVVLPADILPGEYYLGLILDPDDELDELEKQNNVYLYPEPLLVEPRALTIVTDLLPKANQGAQYSFTFVAMSGLGAYVWSADNLPPGMVMAPNGVLQGRPAEAGNFAFTVRVTSGSVVNERVIALQVLPGQSELEVATKALPIAVKGAAYGRWFDVANGVYHEGVQLAASGGKPPYTWELDPHELENRMPEGLEAPTPEGLIKGQATLMSETTPFLVRVRDSLGNENRAWLEIVVVDSGTLVIGVRSYPQATSGAIYSQCIEAQGGDGSYHWKADEASLPPGLVMEPSGAKACLLGVPTACGNYNIGLQVSDDRAQSSTASVSLSVDCGVIQLSSHAVRPVYRGEVIEFQLGAVPSNQPVFSIYRGTLPAGLSLSEDGLITGTVAADASYESHDLILELRDADGRRSVSALTMSVVIEAPPQELVTKTKSKGCGSNSSGDSSAALSTLGLAMLGLGLMRRKTASSRIDSHDI